MPLPEDFCVMVRRHQGSQRSFGEPTWRPAAPIPTDRFLFGDIYRRYGYAADWLRASIRNKVPRLTVAGASTTVALLKQTADAERMFALARALFSVDHTMDVVDESLGLVANEKLVALVREGASAPYLYCAVWKDITAPGFHLQLATALAIDVKNCRTFIGDAMREAEFPSQQCLAAFIKDWLGYMHNNPPHTDVVRVAKISLEPSAIVHDSVSVLKAQGAQIEFLSRNAQRPSASDTIGDASWRFLYAARWLRTIIEGKAGRARLIEDEQAGRAPDLLANPQRSKGAGYGKWLLETCVISVIGRRSEWDVDWTRGFDLGAPGHALGRLVEAGDCAYLYAGIWTEPQSGSSIGRKACVMAVDRERLRFFDGNAEATFTSHAALARGLDAWTRALFGDRAADAKGWVFRMIKSHSPAGAPGPG